MYTLPITEISGPLAARVGIRVTSDAEEVVFASSLYDTDMTTFYIQGFKTIEFSAQNLTSLQVIDIPKIRYLRLYGIERIGNGRQLESGGLVVRNNEIRADKVSGLKCQNWHQRRHRCPLYSRSLPRDVSQPAASLVPVERTGDRMAGNLWSKEVSPMSAVSDAAPAQVHHDSCARSPAPPDYTP
ncbi:uncharacterized protein RCO7_07933 [Rhynchosporium graminicola]|uniref:Uncharacterized protein n=1 Tax=Rhynchosporium graminicola TaxID=2792576 RepID=A0A1E1KNQ1_9HELO|nr:uncharacterized protein RCO7_07933 [Rhynchosporium commune]